MNIVAYYTVGSEVSCSDGACGQLTRVVVDPVAGELTHLVVGPAHQRGAGRLVPIDLVEWAAQEIQLRCTTVQFAELEHADESQFLPRATGPWGYGQGQMLFWPYYGLGLGGGMGMDTGGVAIATVPRTVIHDRVPPGEAARPVGGEHVHATDGAIGRVHGLVIDPRDRHVTHVLLDEGHLWGHKQVAIPIGAVVGGEDGVRLKLTKEQVRDLPPVDLDDEE